MSTKMSNQRGFTLPELLIFCAAIGVMMVIAGIFARPLDHVAERRNAVRWLAVAQHAQALNDYVAKNGELPAGITADQKAIGSEDNMVNLCPVLVPEYAKDLLYDPIVGVVETEGGCNESGALYTTGLVISKTDDNKLTISAPGAEDDQQISLTKQY